MYDGRAPRQARSRAGQGEPGSLADQAYERIRAMIFQQQLAPGTRTGEAQLTRMLGMSRTPVRDALTRLETEGLLHSAPGRGYIVVELDEDDLAGVYQVRAVLEGLAAEQAARRSNRVDIARLEDLFDAMSAAREYDDGDRELARLNSRFHATIAEISGNAFLESMLDDIREVFERFRTTALTVPGRRDDAHHEHQQMIDALRRSDAATAAQLARDHVHQALETRRRVIAVGRHAGAEVADATEAGR